MIKCFNSFRVFDWLKGGQRLKIVFCYFQLLKKCNLLWLYKENIEGI